MLTKYLLALTILLSPTYIVRHKVCCLPLVGEYPTTLLEGLIFLTFGLCLVEKIKLKNYKFQNSNFKFLYTIGLFLVAAGIAVLVSPDKRGGLGIFKAYFVEPLLIFFILLVVVKNKKDWWLMFNSLLLSGLWVAFIAILQVFTGKLVFAPHEAAQGRAHAVYNTANAVGLYLGPILALTLGKFLENLGKVKIIYGLFTIAYVLAIIFSKSRGAMLGTFMVMVFLAVSYFVSLFPYIFISRVIKRFGLKILVLVLGLGLGFGVWFFLNLSLFTPEVENPWVRPGGTGTVRFCVWEGARNLIKEKPIFGSGLSGFKETYSQDYITCDAEPLEYPHNIILNFWTETGLLGLFSFLLVVFFYFRTLLATKNNALKFAFSAAMLYWFVHGLFDVPYFKNDLSLEFWVLVGLASKVGLL